MIESEIELTGSFDVEVNGEFNAIDKIKINGEEVEITNKTINIEIPTNTSDLNNDSNFVDASTLSNVAKSGDYSDLVNKPFIPTKISDLSNDDNFVKEDVLSNVATSGSYNDLSNKPVIPANTSELNNDSGFIDGYEEEDPTVPAHVKAITQEQISNWDNNTGGTGTTNYEDLENKPKINGEELSGNKTLADLNINIPTKTSDLNNDSNFVTGSNITNIVSISQSEYDELTIKNTNTLYVIVG